MNNKLPIFQKVGLGSMQFSSRSKQSPQSTLFLFFVLVVVVFAILFVRLFELTIVKGNYYNTLSNNNRIREVLIEPKRGTILDRKGFVLVHNENIDLQKELNNTNLTERVRSRRIYETPNVLAPVIGYRQTADKSDFKNDPCLEKLQLGDKVGKKGVERLFECDLRGKNGKRLVEVNAQGKFLQTLTILPPQQGKTIQLALDWDLQQKAYDLIKDKKAAVIILNPKNGEVLSACVQ